MGSTSQNVDSGTMVCIDELQMIGYEKKNNRIGRRDLHCYDNDNGEEF